MVPCSERVRDQARVVGLRIPGWLEPYREGVDAIGSLSGSRGDGARVHPPAEEESQGHVRKHLIVYRVVNQSAKLFRGLSGEARLRRLGNSELPVRADRLDLSRRDIVDESMRGRELEDVPEQRLWRRNIVIRQEVIERRLHRAPAFHPQARPRWPSTPTRTRSFGRCRSSTAA